MIKTLIVRVSFIGEGTSKEMVREIDHPKNTIEEVKKLIDQALYSLDYEDGSMDIPGTSDL